MVNFWERAADFVNHIIIFVLFICSWGVSHFDFEGVNLFLIVLATQLKLF